MSRRLVVVGGVAAGMSAAAKAKRTDPGLQVVVYEQSGYISYAACGLPYYIAGDIAEPKDLIVRTPDQMARQGVEVHVHHKVTGIDPIHKEVSVRNLESRQEFTTPYDVLVIATGASPVWPPIPGTSLPGIFGLRSMESGEAIHQYLQECRPATAVIIGGGYIGVEMAETFRRCGIEVTMIVRSGQIMRSALDPEIRTLVEAELSRHGVCLAQGDPTAFEGNGSVQAVITPDATHPCDVALVGIGAEPNVDLAHDAGVALGASGAIATDSAMHTNAENIYAAGDCAEALNLVTGQPGYLPLGSTANKQGRVAGENAAGGRVTFGGIVGTMVVRAFDLAVARTGLTSTQARDAGFVPAGTQIRAKDISHYFPGAQDIHVRLITDQATGRLLGGQIAGARGVAKRVDVLATAIQHCLTVSDLSELDLSYAPPFAPVWDPILVAANVADR